MDYLTWWQIAICVIAAFLGGFATAISGSGGLFTIPIYLIVNLPPFVAFGTNKAVLASGLSLSSYRFYKKNMVDWTIVLVWAIPAFLITAASTYFAMQLDGRNWTFLIAVIIAVGTFSSYPGRKRKPKMIDAGASKKQGWKRPLFLTGVYIYDGIAGPLSGALAYIAILKSRKTASEITEHSALGSTRVLHFITSCGSAGVLAFSDYVAWELVPLLAVFSMAGNYTGAEVASKLNADRLRFILFLVCLASAFGLLIKILISFL